MVKGLYYMNMNNMNTRLDIIIQQLRNKKISELYVTFEPYSNLFSELIKHIEEEKEKDFEIRKIHFAVIQINALPNDKDTEAILRQYFKRDLTFKGLGRGGYIEFGPPNEIVIASYQEQIRQLQEKIDALTEIPN